MQYDPIDEFGISCPAGGTFFVCEDCDIQFLGCCASDPGQDGSGNCPKEDVRYSSFKKNKGANITNQECLDPSGLWYTCFDLEKPFLGCCSSNPCHTGCPGEDVVAAKLSSNPKSAAPFRRSQATETATSASSTSTSSVPPTTPKTPTTSSVDDGSTSPITSSNAGSSRVSTTSLTSAGPTTSSEATATEPASSSQGSSSLGLSKGGTAGISVGATLALLLLAAAVSFFAVRAWRKRREVVFTGSEPPAPGGMVLPASAPYVSRNSHHGIQTASHSHSHSPSQSRPHSPSPSLNSGQRPVLYIVNGSSRQSSISSSTSNHMAGPPPSSGQNNWRGMSVAQQGADHHRNQPSNHHSGRLSELDGVGMPIPELPATSPVQSRTPVVYRPYRPPPRDCRGVPGSPT